MPIKHSHDHGSFSWVDLVSRDMTAARNFYTKLFGWTSADLDTDGGTPYAQFSKNGKMVAGIGEMGDEMHQQGISPMWNSYIHVADINAVVHRAAELGAEITMPVMQVLEAGWLAFFQDPTGGNVGLWQPLHHTGAELMDEPGAFCWNELTTPDAAQACEFFTGVFSWHYTEAQGAPSPYYIVQNKGQQIGGIMQRTAEMKDMAPFWMVYFQVENVDAAVERLLDLGGQVRHPAFDIPVGRFAIVADPQGAVFSMIQMRAMAA